MKYAVPPRMSRLGGKAKIVGLSWPGIGRGGLRTEIMVAAEWAQMAMQLNSTNEAIASPTESWIGAAILNSGFDNGLRG